MRDEATGQTVSQCKRGRHPLSLQLSRFGTPAARAWAKAGAQPTT